MDERETIITKVMEAGGRLRVKSALNPILWLCGIVSVPTIVSVSFAAEKPSWLIAVAAAPVFVAVGGFIFLLIFDRDKLQSEDYQIRKRSLELIEQKGISRQLTQFRQFLLKTPKLQGFQRQRRIAAMRKCYLLIYSATLGTRNQVKYGLIRCPR